jgi:hypothetical protein
VDTQVYPAAISRECCGDTPVYAVNGGSPLTPSLGHSTLGVAIRAKSNSASIT